MGIYVSSDGEQRLNLVIVKASGYIFITADVSDQGARSIPNDTCAEFHFAFKNE